MSGALINPESVRHRVKHFTYAKALKVKTLRLGDVVMITDRANALFDVVLAVPSNDMDIIALPNKSKYALSIKEYDGDIAKLGFKSGVDSFAIIQRSIAMIKKATLTVSSVDVALSAPVDVPENTTIDLNGNSISKLAAYVQNTKKTYFNHIGDNSAIANVRCDNIGADERLIGYTGGNYCRETGCKTGRGNHYLIRFEGVENNNHSDSLVVAAKGKTTPLIKLKKFSVTADVAANTLKFVRARHFPSQCTITHIKVTDANGSPDFYFDLAMRSGSGFVTPYKRLRADNNVNESVNIEWFYDSFDDIFSFNIQNKKSSATQYQIEIFYTEDKFAREGVAWSYQSTNDFNRPHQYGANSKLEAMRVPEYRSHRTGDPELALDVRGAATSKLTVKDGVVDNYGYPITRIPIPEGVQDLNESSELKFYFNFSAGMAQSTGATHIRFRLYHSTHDIKCTCINGFLSQKPDWLPVPGHLATAHQPTIEIDWSGATKDQPIELIIPLDVKGILSAIAEGKAGDLHYFYLTFFQYLPHHKPIVWGGEWVWECEFLKL